MAMAEVFTPAAIGMAWRAIGADQPPDPLCVPGVAGRPDQPGAVADNLDTLMRWVRVLARPQVRVEAVQNNPGLRVLAGSAGGAAVLATQDADPAGAGMVRMRSIQATNLASAVIETLPAQRRGTLRQILLPTGDLATGGDAGVRAALAELTAQPRLRGGTLAVTVRTAGGSVRRSPSLAWFDTPSGRYLRQTRRGHDGREWTVIGPADATTLRQRLAELIGSLTVG